MFEELIFRCGGRILLDEVREFQKMYWRILPQILFEYESISKTQSSRVEFSYLDGH